MRTNQDRPPTFSGNRASQMTGELNGLIHLAQYHGCMSYMEIGSRHGDTFHAIMSELPPGAKGLALDLPGGLWGTVDSRAFLERAMHSINQTGRKAACLIGDSQSDDMVAQVDAWRRGHEIAGPFDLILIDGDHRLPGVTRDWENYSPMARFVAFHDIVGEGQIERRDGNPVEVPILWRSLKAKNPAACVEWIAPKSTMGIGVVDVEAFYGATAFAKFAEALA